MATIRRKLPRKAKSRSVTIEFEGKEYTLKFSSDIDQIISALGIALLALNDPRVNDILKQFGVMFYDDKGNPFRESK